MKRLSQILPVIGAERTDVENWLVRQEFRSGFNPVTKGSARLFTRQNAHELAAVSALVRAGMPVRNAVAFAEVLWDPAEDERREWMIFKVSDPSNVRTTDNLDADMAEIVKGLTEEGCPVFSVIWAGEIRRRVDALFDQPGLAATR